MVVPTILPPMRPATGQGQTIILRFQTVVFVGLGLSQRHWRCFLGRHIEGVHREYTSNTVTSIKSTCFDGLDARAKIVGPQQWPL